MSPSPNIDQNNNNLNEIQMVLSLSPNILYQKRKYVQLIDVFGDVGVLRKL